MVAAERALEAERKDALFEDPFAKALSGSDGLTMSDRLGEAASQFGFDGWPEFHKVWTVVRTKFIDDLISRDTAEIPQMVNLGAGVDTRPYRLDAYKQFKASYEVDTAEVMLRATSLCPVVNVSADFCQAGMLSEKLTEAGFDSQASAVFLIEGVLDFLEEQAEPFLTEVLGPLAAPGSLAIINYAIGPQRPGTFTSTKLKQLLEGLGWQNLQISVFGDERLNYGRYKEGLAPSEDWAFATCVKGAVGPTPEAQEQ
ncbi:unnamed protein product [Durusdinium trenchii]